MFKLAGCVLVLFSSVFALNKKTFENYYTYKFMKTIVEIAGKIEYEQNSNKTYTEIFDSFDFDWRKYLEKCSKNRYISDYEINRANLFFENLGKRDKFSEERYVHHNLEYFSMQKLKYDNLFNENRKINCVCGISAGLFIIIFLF